MPAAFEGRRQAVPVFAAVPPARAPAFVAQSRGGPRLRGPGGRARGSPGAGSRGFRFCASLCPPRGTWNPSS
eukprot:3536537-Lingulodinium_polyedra.AAC.1